MAVSMTATRTGAAGAVSTMALTRSLASEYCGGEGAGVGSAAAGAAGAACCCGA